MRSALALVLGTSLIFSLGACRSDDDPVTPTPDGTTPTTDGGGGGGDLGEATEATISEIKSGGVAAGVTVLLKDVVVSAIDTYGDYSGHVHVQDPAGGANSGISVFAPQVAGGGQVSDLKVGHIVDVVGKVDHWTGPQSSPFKDGKYVIQIGLGGVVTNKGPGTAPTATEVTVATLKNAEEAVKYEGVLVKIVAAKVTEPMSTEYGEFRVLGGLNVDDELYQHAGVAVGDCYDITGILIYFYFHKLAPRDATDMAVNAGGCVAKDVSISDIQDEASNNHPAPDTEVSFTGVVTAVDGKPSGGDTPEFEGFWVQEEGAGGPYKGIYVYHKWTDSSALKPPAVGTKVKVTGIYVEFYDLSEIKSVTAIEDLGAATAIAPLSVTAADLATGGAEFEKYEGVLVTVGPVTVGDLISNNDNTVHFGFKATEADFDVKTDLYDFANPTAPTGSYTSITGVVSYGYSRALLLPRGAEDMQ